MEEEPDGLAASGATLARDSCMEVMVHIEDVEGVLIPGLDDMGRPCGDWQRQAERRVVAEARAK
jgi:hypothetical protein